MRNNGYITGMSVLAAVLLPVISFAGDFQLDRAIGHERNNSTESWIDSKDNSFSGQRESPYDDAVAASFGNAISIETKPGSHVVLNASQINKGNQTSEVSLKGMNSKKYKNVELPKNNPDTYLIHSQ